QSIADCHISLNLPDTTEQFVILASPEHIERAIGNLVDNAVKYTPRNGKIDVQMRCDEVQNMVGIEIQNTSTCPSEIERTMIFERFVRGENSLQMGVPGAGLGLSITDQISQK